MCIVASTAAAVVMAIASVATAATTTAISLSQASAQEEAAAYQIEQTKKEAKKAEMQAAYERQEGVETARREKINSILKLADKKANLASSNIAMSSNTVLNLEDDLKINSELDALTTQKNAEKKAQYYIDKRDNLYANAELTGFKSKVNNTTNYAKSGNGLISATSSLLSLIK